MNEGNRPLELRMRMTLLTPAFIRGAGEDADEEGAEFRAASLRGLLRYWFRALHGTGHEHGPAMEIGPEKDRQGSYRGFVAQTMPQREALLFGSTRAAGLVKILPVYPLPEFVSPKQEYDRKEVFGNSTKERPDRGYLWYSAKINNRSWYKPKSVFRLRLLVDLPRFRAMNVSGWSEQELLEALGRTIGTWSTFSGIGLRSRRAAGAFQVDLEELQTETESGKHLVEPIRAALELLSKSVSAKGASDQLARSYRLGSTAGGRDDRAGFHVASPGSFLAGAWASSGEKFASGIEAVDSLARAYRGARRANRENWDAVHAIDAGEPASGPVPISNAALGLPLMYRFTHGNKSKFGVGVKLQPGTGSGQHPRIDRRGSPLFFTIRRIGGSSGSGGLVVIWCAFDSRFLPDEARLVVKERYQVKEPDFQTVLSILRAGGFLVDEGGAR